jgi:hypothetical protein
MTDYSCPGRVAGKRRYGSQGYTSDNLPSSFARNGSPFGRGYVRYDWLTAETLRPRLSPVVVTYLQPALPCSPNRTPSQTNNDYHGTSRGRRRRCLSKTQTQTKKLPGMYTVSSCTAKMWRRYDHVFFHFRPDLPCRQGDKIVLLVIMSVDTDFVV